MTDESTRQPRILADDVAPPLDQALPQAVPRPSRRRRGVAGGRIAAAGIGIAAMLGLAANMQVASGRASAQPAAGTGPAPTLSGLRVQKAAHGGPPIRPGRIAGVTRTRPIILTPHTVVNTVGGSSSAASGGSSSGGYYAAPAAVAAPVASTSGSR